MKVRSFDFSNEPKINSDILMFSGCFIFNVSQYIYKIMIYADYSMVCILTVFYGLMFSLSNVGGINLNR